MTFWLIAVPSGVVLCALIWWSSGRAKPDLRKPGYQNQIGIEQGRAASYDSFGGGGPDGGGGAGF
jgi:hypothetical protein